MNKNKMKLLRAFMIKTGITQKEFSKEAGICERTLRTALKTGKVSEKTWGKILDTIIAEEVQVKLIMPEVPVQVPAFVYNTLKIIYFLIGCFAILMLLTAIFR